ncbi:O-antigen polysaccharide polymerase Wzy [Solibacillus sp. FSL K6-1126]|uniref:O-antigen polysaccharide polymerase Wzy n=1 Tax=Solibacillus sp. FSL K6-1126 TaxID=2921463 RepID=UPI0030FA1341
MTLNNNRINKKLLKNIVLSSLGILINIFLLLITLSIDNVPIDEWIKLFAFISLAQLFFNIVLLKFLGEELFSLTCLFLIFSYLFHFSYIFMLGFQIKPSYSRQILFNSVPINLIKDTSTFILFVQAFVALGMILIYIKPIKYSDTPLQKSNIIMSKKIIKYMGTICVGIGIIPMIYIDISKLIAYQENGYLAIFELEVRNIYLLAKLTIVGVMLLIIANKENKKMAMVIVFLSIFYQFFSMLSGGRGEAVITIITLTYLYIKVVKEVQFKTIFQYFVIGYIGVIFINIIREYREKNGDFRYLLTILTEQKIVNPIFEIMEEFGGTLLSVCFSMRYFPQYAPIQWGANYLAAAITLLPSNLGDFGDYYNKVEYIYFYPGSRMYMGGSYIGELYYSFNNYGILMALFIGVFVAFISKKIKLSILNERYFSLIIYLILFSGILWWVRDYFAGMIRDLFWISLFLSILYIVVNSIMMRKYLRNDKVM